MQVLQAVMPVGRAGTLRSARLPQRMAAAVEALGLAVPGVQAAEVLVVAAVAHHAVPTPLVLVVLVVLAGHWYWSSDYGSLCRC